ncbi:hypothetical protein BKG96_00985 [Rodentibacter caecimuris]|uniref:DUF945 domain-containing protein n=1 Tax=Rodentibacter caecimuris TaxID=1796644 RepID=A0A1V3KPY5_9PAST|nr:hypothetical protein [Rodentibacter heylii]OOF79737.1 hypothetical protein BKG96_00985 [Rodentibacter heylii]
MTKKTKITLSLSALIVVSGIGAQIYTNHKVDQVLQNFPYSLDNQAKLLVSQTSKNIFTRHLTFSLQNNDNEKTDLITSKLTTLPFFITAESNLSEKFVRQLNKTLNITIDKNTINTKFSPLGAYFSSDILTEFRDFANKSQQSTISLNFRENKEIDLNANLTGFNYDNDSKLKKLEGKVHLIPVTPSQYDLTHIELTAENAELALLNGENTRLQLKNTTYKFHTTQQENNTEKRNLTTKFSSDILRISNKNRTTEESQTTFGGLNISLNQQGVPSAVNFYNEFKKISASQNLKESVSSLLSAITLNEIFDAKLSVLSVNAPKNQKPYFNLKNGEATLKLGNRNLAKVNVDVALNIESVKQMQENETIKWEAKGGKLSGQLNNYNLTNELAFVPFFLDALTVKNPPTKDNTKLLALKDKWAKEFHGNAVFDFTLQTFNSDKLVTNDVEFRLQNESLENDQYNENITLNVKKLRLPPEGIQLENIVLLLPIKQNHYKTYLQSAFCQSPFEPICKAHLSQETRNKYDENQLTDLDLIVDNATLTAAVNTFPETQAYPVKLKVNSIVSKAQKGEKKTESGALFLNNLEGSLNLAINKMLIDDTNEKAREIKALSPLWRLFLLETVKPQGKLSDAFEEKREDYVLTLEKNESGYFINGKSLEDLQQQLQMKEDKPEENESDQ